MTLALSYEIESPPNSFVEQGVNPMNDDPWPIMYGNQSAFGGSAGFLPSSNPITALATGVPQIGNDAAQSPGTSLYDLIGRALQVYQLDRQQRAFLETNQNLIMQGRQPIAWDQFQPTASVGVQLDSNTRQMLWIFGGGALALLAMMALRK